MADDDLEKSGPRNGSSLVVSLKDYFERIILEFRTYMERIFEEYRIAHNAKHVADEEALRQRAKNIDDQLNKTNELRSKVEKDRSQFVRVEVFSSQVAALNKSIRTLEDTAKLMPTDIEKTILNVLEPRIDVLETFKKQTLAIAGIAVFLAGAFGFLLSRLFPPV